MLYGLAFHVIFPLQDAVLGFFQQLLFSAIALPVDVLSVYVIVCLLWNVSFVLVLLYPPTHDKFYVSFKFVLS